MRQKARKILLPAVIRFVAVVKLYERLEQLSTIGSPLTTLKQEEDPRGILHAMSRLGWLVFLVRNFKGNIHYINRNASLDGLGTLRADSE